MAATGLLVLVIAGATYGLIPPPEVRTRIGEVPSISRSFLQEAMAPRLAIQALGDPAEERLGPSEVTGMAPGQSVQVPLGTHDGSNPAGMVAPLSPADDGARSSDPLGELIEATTGQTLEPSPSAVQLGHQSKPPAETGANLGATASPAAGTESPPPSAQDIVPLPYLHLPPGAPPTTLQRIQRARIRRRL